MQVFCCSKCRQKHEDKAHQDMQAIRQICYICNKRPFPLRIDTKISSNNLLIDHILKEHLPLRCNRCTKVFYKASDFKLIERCKNLMVSKKASVDEACYLECANEPLKQEMKLSNAVVAGLVESQQNVAEKCTCNSSVNNIPPKVKFSATQATTQVLQNNYQFNEQISSVNQAALTPLSMINLRWKRKSLQSFDSMFSTTTNISAVNASDGQLSSPKKKLVRSTSTPMMQGCLKNVNESYSSVIGQMSSIHSNSGSEIDSKNNDITPASAVSFEINKVRALIRSRSKVAATPLRQVMSKSIQRAIVQHGYYSKMLAPGTQRKMSFSSTTSSGLNSTESSPSQKVLDLRTTPVLKRSASESSASSKHNPKFSYRMKIKSANSSVSTLEDISQTPSEYYDACPYSFCNSSKAEQENRDNQMIAEQSIYSAGMLRAPGFYQDTPRVASEIPKKVISFTTPDSRLLTVNDSNTVGLDDSTEVWATPCGLPHRSLSCSAFTSARLDSLTSNDTTDHSSSDDVFLATTSPKSKSNKHQHKDPVPTTGRLWTIVSHVIRLAARTEVQEDLPVDSTEDDLNKATMDTNGTSLVRKAASFASFLKNKLPIAQQDLPHASTSDSDERSTHSSSKRRRTNTLYTRPYETIPNSPVVRVTSSPLAKRKRIQGRQPIERMLRMSSKSGSASDL